MFDFLSLNIYLCIYKFIAHSSSYFVNTLYDVGFFEAVRKIFEDEDDIDEGVIA